MFIPYNVDVPMRRWPFANWALIAVTIHLSIRLWNTGLARAQADKDDIIVTQVTPIL